MDKRVFALLAPVFLYSSSVFAGFFTIGCLILPEGTKFEPGRDTIYSANFGDVKKYWFCGQNLNNPPATFKMPWVESAVISNSWLWCTDSNSADIYLKLPPNIHCEVTDYSSFQCHCLKCD